MVRFRPTWGGWWALLVLSGLSVARQAQAQTPDWPRSPEADPAVSLCDVDCILSVPRCPFYCRIEGLALRRDVHRATDFATVNDADTLMLSTRDLDKPFKAGPSILLGHTFNDSVYQVEFSYFTLTNWDDAAAVRDATINTYGLPGNLFSPFSDFSRNTPVFGFDYNDEVSIHEFSYMQNGELNLVRLLPMPPERLTAAFIIGARHMMIRERFDYFSHTITVDDTGVPGDISNTVNVRTRNELWGAQIGGRFEFYCEQKWWINTELKGAICNNSAGQTTGFTQTIDQVPSGPFTFARGQNATSFIGDIAVTAICRPTPWLTARVGYQAICHRRRGGGQELQSQSRHSPVRPRPDQPQRAGRVPRPSRRTRNLLVASSECGGLSALQAFDQTTPQPFRPETVEEVGTCKAVQSARV